MPYRPITRRRHAPVRSSTRAIVLHRQALAGARAASARRNGSSLPTFLAILGIAIAAMFTAGSVVAGATAVGVVETLESDLPDP